MGLGLGLGRGLGLGLGLPARLAHGAMTLEGDRPPSIPPSSVHAPAGNPPARRATASAAA